VVVLLSEEAGEGETEFTAEAGEGEIEFPAGVGEGVAAVSAESVFWKVTETAVSEPPLQSEIIITAATKTKVTTIDMISALLSFKGYFPHMDIKAFIFGLAFREICPYNNC